MISKTDLDKPLSELSKLRAEQVSKYRAGEEMERLEAIGQTSDKKARKWVKEAVEQAEKQASEQREIDFAVLEKLKKHKVGYFRYLAVILGRFLAEESIPRKYRITTDLTDQGVVVAIEGTRYQGTFKPCGLVSYDRHACKILAVQLGNTIAKLEGNYNRTEAGIILPDQEDQKIYG